jgi:enoyl-CoA hydratase/carnithine racemase
MYKNLLLELDAEIAIITLNRPSSRNALSLDLMLELLQCLAGIENNGSIRVVILAAAGKAYCAGHDLTEMTDRTPDEYRLMFSVCTDLMTKLQSIPQPVMAEVQGIATAAGCQLVATCDLAVASDRASFATPGVRIGLFCTTPMVALTRAIGRKRALEMLFTGEAIDATRAADWGLINRVVPEEQLRKTCRALAQRIAEASPMTLALGKQAYYAQADLDQATAYSYAQQVMAENAMAADAKEGIAAFLEKRRAHWCGGEST